MWYVIQVNTGTEERIRTQCRKLISESILTDVFLPRYREQKKLGGQWQVQERLLFPGYVFAVTDHVDELIECLRKVIGLTKVLATGDDIVPLLPEEVEFLQSFGGEEQVVGLSSGIIIGTRVIVQSGPLVGKEGYIRKIDRHKRKAWLELPMFGRLQKIEVSLEIVSKTKEAQEQGGDK